MISLVTALAAWVLGEIASRPAPVAPVARLDVEGDSGVRGELEFALTRFTERSNPRMPSAKHRVIHR